MRALTLKLQPGSDILAGRNLEGLVKRLPALAAAVLTATTAFSQAITPPKTPWKVGDTAPDFAITANNTTNRTAVKLSDFRGKKNVILAFFPAAFTGG
jgi:hypothetical protein